MLVSGCMRRELNCSIQNRYELLLTGDPTALEPQHDARWIGPALATLNREVPRKSPADV